MSHILARTASSRTASSRTASSRAPLPAVVLAVLAAVLVTLAACTNGSADPEAEATGLPETVSRASAPPVDAVDPVQPSLTVTDAGGAEIVLEQTPERIVCVTGACDDMLFSLGLEPVGTSTPGLLALTAYLGDAAAEITTIPGAFGNEDIEAIADLEPDLVIGLAGVHEGLAEPLAPFAPLWTLTVGSYQDSVKNLRALAALVDRPEEGAEVERAFSQALADARATSAENGLDEVVALTMYSSGAGRGVNTEDDLLGGLTREVFAYPWPNKGGDYETAQAYSVEEILEKDPEIIFVQSFTTGDGPTMSEELADDPAWSRIAAVRTEHVAEVSPALWSSGRGPHALTLVLEQMLDAVAA